MMPNTVSIAMSGGLKNVVIKTVNIVETGRTNRQQFSGG